ncbi:MAG: hypothetical protein LBJ08_00605 [Bifidobacteriaceae bacterium]|jgi:hypothetical protein|nr:hypothetical protein [Bifidobacteriaceae bacterium]
MASRARTAAAANNTSDNPFRLGTRGYWAVQDAIFDKFMATHDQCIEELRQLVRSTGGPDLDGSVESLGPLNDWLKIPVLLGAKWDDGYDWWPTWGRIYDPDRPDSAEMNTLQYYRLEGRVAFYYADVLISQLPRSKWVCWRAEEFNVGRTGDFLVDIGTFPTPADPLSIVRPCAFAPWRASLDPSDPNYSPPANCTLTTEFQSDLGIRTRWLLKGRPLDFQAAPTGDEAGINRGPYKGSRIKAKWLEWYDR